jgi:glutathione S-transferase
MSLTIYGTSRSRAFRVLWMAEELGLTYSHHPIGVQDAATDPAYLAINPAGRIPCLVDDGLILAESLAINLHLAERHGRLKPRLERGDSLAMQWSFWAATTIEAPYSRWAASARWCPAARRDPRDIAAALADLERPLSRLSAALSEREWLVGDVFSVADLNVASVIPLLRDGEAAVPTAVAQWLRRCCGRDAYAAAAAKP